MNRTSVIRILVVLEMCLAICLVLYRLGDNCLWLDEVYTVTTVRHWTTLWHNAITIDGNAWFYHLLLHFWMYLGNSEFIVRSLSAVFFVATVPVCYALGARLFNSRVGLIAGLLLAVNPFLIQYGQEARAYSLLALLAMLSTYFFAVGMGRPCLTYSLGHILFSVLSIWTHYFGLLVLVAQAISLILRWKQETPWKRLMVHGAAICLLLGLSMLPFLETFSGRLTWIPRPDLGDLSRLFLIFSGWQRPLLWLYFGSCVAALGFAAIQLRRSQWFTDETWPYAFLAIGILAPVAITYTYSILIKPVFWDRYLIICVPPLVVLVASGVAMIRSRWLLVLILAAFLLFSKRGVWSWYDYQKPNWREIVNSVVANVKPGDALMFHVGHSELPFNYYLETFTDRKYLLHQIDMELKHNGQLPQTIGELIEQLPNQYPRIWVILKHPYINSHDNDVRQWHLIDNAIRRNYKITQNQQFINIHVLRYDR